MDGKPVKRMEFNYSKVRYVYIVLLRLTVG